MYKRKYEDFEDDCCECLGKIFLRIDYYIITFILNLIFIYIIKFILENTYYKEEYSLEVSILYTIFILYPALIFLILKDIIYIKDFMKKTILIYLLCFAITFNLPILIINFDKNKDVFIFFRNPLYVLIALPIILIIAQNLALQLLKNFSREKDY